MLEISSILCWLAAKWSCVSHSVAVIRYLAEEAVAGGGSSSGLVSSNWKVYWRTQLETGCLQQASCTASSSASGKFLTERPINPSTRPIGFSSGTCCSAHHAWAASPSPVKHGMCLHSATPPLQFDLVLLCEIVWTSGNSLFSVPKQPLNYEKVTIN